MLPFSSGASSAPFVDWISVSFPSGLSTLLLDALRPIVSVLPGVSAMPYGHGWSFPSGGLLQVRSRSSSSAVSVLSASGAALSVLRDAGVFADLLRVLASDLHRVTRLDVALDLPVHAPPLLQSLYARSVRGEVSLSRKALNPARHVTRYLSPSSTGEDTGTVYLGGRSAEVKARVYDKRQECLARGLPDLGPLLRAELTVTGAVGVSLRDAWSPAAVFWHFMGSALTGIAARPVDVPEWVPGGVGFCLPPRPVLDPVQRLERRLDRSAELRDLCELACSVKGGAVLVYRRLRKLGLPLPSELRLIPDFLKRAVNDVSWSC